MIAWLLHERGLSNKEIRDEVFKWANRNAIYLDFNVNSIIYHVQKNVRRMRGETEIYVSEDDVANINSCVDSKVCKKVALAILCYAKATADSKGDFQMSSNALGAWLGIAPSNLRGRYLKELRDF